MPIKPGTNATIRGEAIEMVNNGVEVNGGHSLVLVLLLLLLLLLLLCGYHLPYTSI